MMLTKEDEVTAKYTPTVEDSVDAFRIFYKHSNLTRQDRMAGIILVVFGAASIYFSLVFPIFWGCTIFAFLVAWWFGTGFYRQVLARQQFKQASYALVSFAVAFSDDGIDQETSNGRVQIFWTTCSEILETEKFFVFFYKNSTYGWLPKQGFASDADVEEARRLFRKHIETHSLMST